MGYLSFKRLKIWFKNVNSLISEDIVIMVFSPTTFSSITFNPGISISPFPPITVTTYTSGLLPINPSNILIISSKIIKYEGLIRFLA